MGGSVTFVWLCPSENEETCINVQWLLNGTPLEQLPHINADQNFNASTHRATLMLTSLTLDIDKSNVEARGHYPEIGPSQTIYHVGELFVEGQCMAYSHTLSITITMQWISLVIAIIMPFCSFHSDTSHYSSYDSQQCHLIKLDQL